MSDPELDFRSQEFLDTIRYFRSLKTEKPRSANPFSKQAEQEQKQEAEANTRAKILLRYFEDLMDNYQTSQSQFMRLLVDIEKLGLQDTETFRKVLLRRVNRELNKFQ
jgi:hypothetical protein